MIGFHTFRHTCATTLFRHGWNAVQVQKALGHHSPAFTLSVYVHLLAEDLPEAAFLDDVVGMPAGMRAPETAGEPAPSEARLLAAIAGGDSLPSPSVTRKVIDRMAEQPAPDTSSHERLAALTPREREVLELVARGLSNGEIADVFVIEESTVKTHVKRKLRLRDRVQAVILAY